MRKNGINKELRPVEGGVCAVAGFQASGVACGIRGDGTEDLGLIFSQKRCPTACVYTTCKRQSAPVEVTKTHVKNGYAQAILVNGGVANAYFQDGVQIAEKACRLLEKPIGVSATDTVIVSTGRMGKKLTLTPFEKGVPTLCATLTDSASGSLAFVRAIRGGEGESKDCAFAFSLGDFTGRIGAAFSGGTGTTLVLLTTDVNISPEMLDRALSAEVRETLYALCTGDTQSPNDAVCMMANGRLGNYRIDCEDTEYKKFCLALRGVLTEICKEMIKASGGKFFCCKVTGARSKQTARMVAKAVMGLQGLKRSIHSNQTGLETLLCGLADCGVDLNGVRIGYSSSETVVTVFDEGLALDCTKDTLKRVFDGKELEMRIQIGAGNYAATAFGGL